jgi:hypothetical protein
MTGPHLPEIESALLPRPLMDEYEYTLAVELAYSSTSVRNFSQAPGKPRQPSADRDCGSIWIVIAAQVRRTT